MFVSEGFRDGCDGYGGPVAPESSSQVAKVNEPSEGAGVRVGSTGPAAVRYRCVACGNLTRFDVVANRRTRSFHHYSLAGENVKGERTLQRHRLASANGKLLLSVSQH